MLSQCEFEGEAAEQETRGVFPLQKGLLSPGTLLGQHLGTK